MSTQPIAAAASATQGGRPWARALRLGGYLLMPLHLLAVASAAKSFRDNPVIGDPELNRRGLHVARRKVAARLARARRRRLAHLVPAADRDALDRDGFVVRPDFLDAATFAAFRKEILDLSADAREAVIGDTLTRLIPLDAVTLRRCPTARRELESPEYRGLLNYVGSFRRRPLLYVQTVFPNYCEGERDIQSFWHSDTFHPTVKAWFFLEDVGEDEAPFSYVPESHRCNPRRLAWERRVSIDARTGFERLTAEGSFRIGDGELARLGYPAPVKLAVKANTLVVADTSGFHARGAARGTTARVCIWAYSRSNPFLPWTGGDLASLPVVKGYGRRLYWAVADRLKAWSGRRDGWRWVGRRTPLARPEGAGP